MSGTFARFGAGIVAAAMLSVVGLTEGTSAQVFSPQRDCYTLLKCQYAKGSSFRGCISTYSCKYCRFVPASCTVRGEAKCRRLKCGFGA